eukprot:12916895-Prorocentrum_lima.AAC.1
MVRRTRWGCAGPFSPGGGAVCVYCAPKRRRLLVCDVAGWVLSIKTCVEAPAARVRRRRWRWFRLGGR